MTTFQAEIISKGRITIPSEIRQKLDLKKGDHVQVEDIKKLVPQPNPVEKAEEDT